MHSPRNTSDRSLRRNAVRPRVLILNHNVVEHGTYFRAWKVAEVLRDRGAQVTFCVTGKGHYRTRHGRRQGVEVWETPNWAPFHGPDDGWSPLGVLWRFHAARSRKWDLVYSFSHHPVCWWPAWAVAQRDNAPLVVDWCDLYGGEGILGLRRALRKGRRTLRHALRDGLDGVEERLEGQAAANATLLTVISGFLRDRAIEQHGADSQRVHSMPSGASLDAIRPQDRIACRRELGVPDDAEVLGYLANYHPDEELMLDAVGRVARSRPGVRLLCCGNAFYGGEEALARHGLTDRVTHVGRVPFERIQTVLGAADVCLTPMTDSPFNRSRWPNKICDYLAAGRPQVACAVGDVGPFFERHAVGLACRPEPEDFARKIGLLLDDLTRREEMGRTARAVAEQEMDWRVITDRMFEALLRVRPDSRGRLESLVGDQVQIDHVHL